MASKVNPRSSQSLSQCACYKCNKNVFQLEKIIVGDHSLHESCFVCETCNCRLSSSNYTEQEGSYYCTKHSHIITQEENPKTVADTNSSTDEKICPFCKKQVYTADGVILDNEELVHRSCFACSECNVSLTLGNFHTIQQKLFCTRHYYAAASNSPDINSRKKVRDLYTGSLDADPLLSSLEDLEVHEQNQKKSSTLENNSLVPPLSLKMMHEHSSPSSDDQKKETTEENKETEEEKEKNEFRDTTNATKNEISDEGAKDSISYSENALDTEEDEQEKIDVSGDEPSEASPGPGRLSRSRSRKKKELKAHALNRKDTPEEKDTKKKSKKKRKGERSETEDTEDGGNDSSKQKGRRREKSRKQRNSQRVDNEPEDTKEDKKKKSKRGLFSIKKKPTRSSSGRKGSEDGSHSPSLTAFVSSRFRKPRKDSLTEQNAPKPLSPKLSPAQHQTKYSKPIESDSDESEGEPHDILQELAPLGSPDTKNRLARLNRGDSKDSKRPSSGLGLETRNKPPAILPVSLTVPVPFTTLQSLSTCANTIDEDIPLESLNIPETKEGLVWSSYELTRKLPTIDVTLPDDITPKPADVNERIMQDGYFIPTIFTFGVVGVQRRVLDYLSILQTTYPFDIKVIAGADVSPKAIQVLQERHGESFKEVSITQLLSMDLDWIIIGSTHNNTCENILLSLNSGKNVFCEKPVCLSVVDCLKIRDAHAKSGKKFYGGFVWRLVPFYQEIYEILHSNILGDIISAEANHLMSPSETGPLMSTSSRLRKYCQTPLFDTFCFEIDIINWLLESVPSKVGSFSGLNIFTPQNKPTGDEIEPYLDWEYKPVEENISLDPFSSEKDIDDNHVIMMEYRNKVRVTCHVNTNSAFPQRRILICGLKGTLEGDLYTGTIRYKKISEQYETNIIQVTPGVAHGGGDQQIMENLMNATKNEPTDSFEGEEIFPSVITVLGIDQSKKEGKIIDLEPQWKKLGI